MSGDAVLAMLESGTEVPLAELYEGVEFTPAESQT
jgi:hypothetical protein